MATFAYTGRTRAGETVTGERVADNMDAAVAALRREQVQVTKITPAKEKAAAKAETKKAGGGKTTKGVSAKNLAVFTRQFSVMIDAGLPLVQCLDILGNQEEDKHFAEVRYLFLLLHQGQCLLMAERTHLSCHDFWCFFCHRTKIKM